MKKNLIIAMIASVCCVLILSACSFGFAPAWKAKNNTATVSLKFSAIDGSASLSSNRAIVQGGGFLYIRTIGGPSGDNGGYYGPFQVKGTNFTTTEIPAGTYTHIALVYAADNMNAMTFDYKGTIFTFPQLMQQSDDEVLLLFTENDDGPEPTDASEALIEEGSLSMCLTGKTIIKAGTTNAISATLLPNTQSSVDMETNPNYEFTPTLQNRLTKKFIRLINVNPGAGSSTTPTELVCQIKPSGGPATIGIVALYNEEGKLVKSFSSTGTVAEGTAISFSAPYTSGSTFYLYFECQGARLDFAFQGAGANGSVAVSITGATAHIGKKVNFGVFTTQAGTPGGFPDVAGGMFTIGSDGSGTAFALEIVNNMTQITPGSYYLSAFIDVNGNAGPGMGPDWGDLVLTGTGYIPVTVTTAKTDLNLTLANFTGYQPYPGVVYYVSNTGSGSGLGTSPSDTCTLMYALYTTIPVSGVSAPNYNIIVLTEHISDTYASPYSINKPVVITSLGGPWTITLAMNHSGNYIGVIASGTLILEKAGISAATSFMANMSLISIVTSGTFIMKSGSLIKDNKIMMTGGSSGVKVDGGDFVMQGGEISGCETSGTAQGGAVLVNTGSFTMSGGQISGNTSATNGGGVTVVNGTVTMTGGTISGNTAMNNGGGISIAMGSFTMTSGSISGNAASGTGGGGIYLATGSTLTCFSACSITGNSASAGMGGGLYSGSATIIFDGTPILGGNSGLLNGSIFNGNTASSSAQVYVF